VEFDARESPPPSEELQAAVAHYFSDPVARVGADTLLAQLSSQAPVLRVGEIWFVSRYAEICGLVAGGGVRSSPTARGQVIPMSSSPTMATLLALMFPMMDGDDHRRLRGLSAASFGPRRIEALRRELAECVSTLWRDAVEKGKFDVVADIAETLPAAVAAIQMGTPREERDAAQRWASVAKRYHMNYDLVASEIATAEEELGEFAEYVDSLCALRRRSPGDDLLSELTAAADAGRMTKDELVAYVLNMYMNGVDTLTSALTMAIWELVNSPDDLARCGADVSFAQAAFVEAVRLHSPVRFGARFLSENQEMGGCQLHRDDPVVLFYAAANRDPARYPDPATFLPMRTERRHLGFGHGSHHCIGQQLSLLTGALVLQELGNLGCRLEPDVTSATLPWGDELAFCTLTSLPVVVVSADS
jgi:cytochrome P450